MGKGRGKDGCTHPIPGVLTTPEGKTVSGFAPSGAKRDDRFITASEARRAGSGSELSKLDQVLLCHGTTRLVSAPAG